MKFNFFNIFIYFIFFSFQFDTSFTIYNLISNGEILSQSEIINDSNYLRPSSKASIPIEFLDVFLLISFIYLLAKYKLNIINKIFIIKKNNPIYIKFWLFFCFFICISFITNFLNYSYTQNIYIFLHFMKLIEVLIISLIIFYFINTVDYKIFTNSFFYYSFFSAGLLLLITFGYLNFPFLIQDRMETGISILFSIIILFYCYEVCNKNKSSKFINFLYALIVFMYSLALINQGKRAILLILIFLAVVFLIISIYKKKINLPTIGLLFSILFSFNHISSEVEISLLDKFEGIKKSRYDTYLNEKVLPEYSEKHNTNLLKQLLNLSLFLDGSGAERVAKIFYSLDKINPSKITGTGFWGIKYYYNYLPDSVLQIPIEIGIIGSLCLFLFLLSLFMSQNYNFYSIFIKFCLVSVITLAGFFCNPFYMFRVVSFLIILIYFINYMDYKLNNPK